MKNKKYILWDNDGVLVETEKWYYEASKKALTDLSIPMEFDAYMKVMVAGTSVFDIITDYGHSPDDIVIHRARRDEYYQEFLKTENLDIPDTENVLKILSTQYKMGIVTSSRRVDFDLVHNKRPLINYMDFVLAGGEYPKHKPHPDPYLAGMEKFKATRDETIVIEDSQRGLTSALAAEIDCIIIKNEFTKTQDFTGAQVVMNSILDLPGYLRGGPGKRSQCLS